MKQKRKENCSLHSSKQCLNAIGAVTLLGVVCGVLGIISVGLLTKSAIAAGDGNTSSVAYTGVDDKVDVVVGLNFIDQDNQSKDLYNFYESGDNLYVTPNNVVVNVTNTNGEILRNNEVIGSVYGHVLGGEGNKLNSDNVTIIAGSSNEIGVGNTNAVLLGGTGNTMGGSEALALVGGEGNDANKKDGLIIGGNNNRVNGGNGSASVLGGERNEVLGDNAVVGGLGIRMAQSLKNVFAYSNRNVGAGNFITKSSDAFYLDIKSGLGINLESTKGGVEMQGAMGFGEVDINQGCNDSSNNYGVQGTWNGCMVGCTKAGGGKWQLLDSSESCKAKCEDNNSRCVVDVYNPTSVAGRCADSTVSTMHTTKCGTSGSYEQYKNAIFEVTLVDQGKCPGNSDNLGNNQCVYACDSTSHLTGDTTGKISDARNGKGCYQDCKLDGKTVKHNETLYGYQNKQVTCSNDANSPTSPQTCINHDNRAELLCVDGRWYDKTHGKWKDENKYNNSSCTLSSYTNRCTALGYKLTKSGITSNSKKYYDYNMNWNNTDRGESKGERGIYVLCKDWTASGIDTCKSTETNPVQYHYYLKGCKNEYTRFSSTRNQPDSNGDQCRKNCSFNGQIFTDGGTTLGFKLADVNCAGKCESATLTCKDGTWYVGSIANADSIYSKGDCTLHDGTKCQSKFNLTVKPNSTTTKFETCVDYTAVGKYTCNPNYKYHKTGCQPGYEGENCDPISKCTDLPSNAEYNNPSKKPSTDTKAFYDPKSTKACAFSCNDNYKWEDGKCRANGGYQCTNEPDGAKLVDGTDSGLTKDTPAVLKSYTYKPNSSEKCIYKCDHESNMYLIGGKCIKLSDVCIKTEKYKCNGGAEVTNKKEKDGVYTWDCEADGEVIANCTFGGDIDGECDFSQTNKPACKNGVEPKVQTDYPDVTVWNCEGIGNGKLAVCGLRTYCDGTCESAGNSLCQNLLWDQSAGFDKTKKSHCVNAGGYGSSTNHGDGRCYINENAFPSMGLKSCGSYGGSYASCFKWEAGDAVCEVLDSGSWKETSADKCEAIKSKVTSVCGGNTQPVENKKYWLKTLANDYGGPCKGLPTPVDNTFMGLATPSYPYITYSKDNMGNIIGSTPHWPAEFSTLTEDGRVGTENDWGTYAWAKKQINEKYGDGQSWWRRYNPSTNESEGCEPGSDNCTVCMALVAI